MVAIERTDGNRADPHSAGERGQGEAGASTSAGPSHEAPTESSRLSGLASITPGDAGDFLAAAEAASARCWFAYFPRLHFYGGIKGHDLIWERHGDAILIYQLRRKKDEVRLNLYLPPFPFDPSAMRHAKERMRDFNTGSGGRIVFVQESEALKVARAGFEIIFKDEEYIYDRVSVMALEGSRYSTLRRKLAAADRDNIVTRPYAMSDLEACLALTKGWRERLRAGGINPTSYRHTIACLAGADRFPPSLLTGMIAESDGVVRGFAFAGPIMSRIGAIYLTINDTSAPSAAYCLRYRLMEALPTFMHFNDSTDTKRLGLRELKRRFRPLEMLRVYGGRDR